MNCVGAGMTVAIRRILIGASLAVLTAVAAGCSGPELSDNGAPPSAPTEPPPPPPQPRFEPPPPPPAPDATELLGGPDEGQAPPEVIRSTPIPNPEDLSPEDRAQIYGPARGTHHPYVHGRHYGHGRERHGWRHHAQHPLVRHGWHGHHPLAAPSAHPPSVGRHNPHSQAPAPHPLAPPAVHAKPPAAVTPPPSTAKPAPAPMPWTKLQQLGVSLNGEVISAAKLVVPAEVLAGKPGVVSLTLPPTLAGELTAHADKLGLSRAARTADASAVLSGEGYGILPDGVQTARLKTGEATTFNWQVTPSASAKPPLMVDIGADLKGQGKPQSFTIGEVIGPSAPSAAANSNQAAGGGSVVDKLAVPGNPTVQVPGFGAVRSGVLVALFIGLLIVVLVAALYNRARNDRLAAERRRRDALREEREAREREERLARETRPTTPEQV